MCKIENSRMNGSDVGHSGSGGYDGSWCMHPELHQPGTTVATGFGLKVG